MYAGAKALEEVRRNKEAAGRTKVRYHHIVVLSLTERSVVLHRDVRVGAAERPDENLRKMYA